MDWVTGLKRFRFQELNSIRVKVKPSPFRALAWKILGYYLLAMMAIGGISNLLIYQFVARSLYQKCDLELATLADAASHSLVAILQDPNHVQSPVHRPLDGDHDLDLSWQVLQQPEQGIEWFDVRGNLLVATGYPFPFAPLDFQAGTAPSPQGSVSLRRLTLPVYQTTAADSPLLGYVRVTESTEYVYQTLRQLQQGFLWGELCALTLTAIAGLGLIHQVLKPIKRSYAQLQQFTGDASHELRTPLAVIKTSVEVLQTHRQNFAREDQNKLAHILSATNQMGNLVNDLLLLARQDGERKSESFMLIPLDEILEDVLPWMELAAEKKQLSLMSNLASGIYIKGNPDLLKRVFINLLDNAIKYTNSPGKITLTLNPSAKFAVVIVQDTGVGIAPEQIPLMFDRFWRACLARSPQVTGSGLGLAIVQSIVKSHGGQIQVNSELGKGTTLQVKFPLVSCL